MAIDGDEVAVETPSVADTAIGAITVLRGRGVRDRHVMERSELDLDDPAASLPGDDETGIDRESMEPGFEPAGVAQPAQVPPCSEGRLLDRVARELSVPEDQSGSQVQTREVHADERAEGFMIALACPLDETPLVHGIPSTDAAECRVHRY